MYIIAEIGINHQGDMALAKAMIQMAKDCGADAVKFQLYDSDKLLEPELAKRVRHCDLSREQWQGLVEFADIVKMPISASVFDLERLEWLKATDPPWYKVASRTFKHDADLTKAILSLGKTSYISLGMAESCLDRIWSTLENYKHAHYVFCVSDYPATITFDHLDLWRRWSFSGYHGIIYNDNFVGFSSHTGDIEAPLWAIAHGAKVIEVHFSPDKSQPGVDQVSSIEPDDLRTLCRLAPEIERLAGL